MKKQTILIISLIILTTILSANTLAQDTTTVCETGCDHTTIQNAINNANEEDTILVSEGEYDGFTINKPNLTISSTEHAKITTRSEIQSTTTIKGLYFDLNGKTSSSAVALSVSGDGTKLTILNSVFTNIQTGIYANNNHLTQQTTITAKNNIFKNAVAGIGGTENTITTIEGNNFINSTEGIGLGNGVIIEGVCDYNIIKILTETNTFEKAPIQDYRTTIKGVCNKNTFESYKKIQEAINNASEGDTILVNEGEYEEPLTINVTGLTLKSVVKHDAIITGGINTITAKDVIIDGFKFIEVHGDNRILINSNNTTLQNINLTTQEYNNESVQGTEIVVQKNTNEVKILNNTINRKGKPNNAGAALIKVLEGANNTLIKGNIISDNSAYGSIGLGVGDDAIITIKNNTIHSAWHEGIWFYPVHENGNIIIENNTIFDYNIANEDAKALKIINKPASVNSETITSKMRQTIIDNNQIPSVELSWKTEIVNSRNDTFYNTIQSAINAAQPNDTIRVAPGIYEENIVMNKTGLTLLSTEKHEAVINGTVSINANNINLTNLYINYTGTDNAPLDLINNENLTLIGNKVRGGSNTGGISTWTGPANIKGNVLIKDNEIIEGPIGIISNNEHINLTIINNIITDAGDEGIWVVPGENTNLTIINNTVHNSGKNDVKIVDKPEYVNEENESLNMLDTIFEENDVSSVYLEWMMILEDDDLSEFNAFDDNQLLMNLMFIVGKDGEPNSMITLFNNTNISSEDDFNLDNLFADLDIASYSISDDGRDTDRILKWGLNNVSLEFDLPVKIEFFVGTSFNGEELEIYTSRNREDWTSLEDKTCTVSEGYCTFETTSASYFAAIEQEEDTDTGNNGGSPTIITRTAPAQEDENESVDETSDDASNETSDDTTDGTADDVQVNETEEVVDRDSEDLLDGVNESDDVVNETEEDRSPSGLTGLVTGINPGATFNVIALIVAVGLLGSIIYYRSSTVTGLSNRAESLHRKADAMNKSGMYKEALDTRRKARRLQRKADEKGY